MALNNLVILIFIIEGYFCFLGSIVKPALLLLSFISFSLAYLYLNFERRYFNTLSFASPFCLLMVFYLANEHNLSSPKYYGNIKIPFYLCAILMGIVLGNLFCLRKKFRYNLSHNSDNNEGFLISHWGGFFPIPTNWMIPFMVWILLRNRSPWVRNDALEGVDFQLSIAIYFLIFFSMINRPPGSLGEGLGIAFFVIIIMFILQIIALVNSIKRCRIVSNDVIYRYPFNMRLVSRVLHLFGKKGISE